MLKYLMIGVKNMIILNREAILVIEEYNVEGVNYKHAHVVYNDGYILNIGEIKSNEGNFLYDSEYVLAVKALVIVLAAVTSPPVFGFVLPLMYPPDQLEKL